MGESLFHDEHVRAAVIQYVIEVIGHQAKVQRHQNRPEQRRPEEGFKQAMAILREHRHAVALLNA